MINAIVTDPAVLAARTPPDLAMYLRSQQWRLETRNGVAARWTKVVGEDEFEVAQPLDSDLRDYASRVHDVVETLALVERRSELDIIEQMSQVSTEPTEVLHYLCGVRIGPSSAGSFVLSMHTPVPPKLSTEGSRHRGPRGAGQPQSGFAGTTSPSSSRRRRNFGHGPRRKTRLLSAMSCGFTGKPSPGAAR